MIERRQVRDAVFRAIDEVRSLSFDADLLTADEAAVLFGDGAALDSMGFVNFLVALEEEMSRLTARPQNLVETFNASDGRTQPIVTAGELIDSLYARVANP